MNIGIPMICGHDIEHKEEVCIVCVIANETVNILDLLDMFATINHFESEEALSIIQHFLADAREYMNKPVIKGEK
jgi:hypothetical protein